MKNQFVFFCNEADYYYVMFRDIINLPNVQFFSGNMLSDKGAKKYIEKVHTSKRLNKIVNIPFKSCWYHQYYDSSILGDSESAYFVFFESNKLSYDYGFINYLRNKHKGSKIIFFFTNIVKSSPINNFINEFRKNYDLVITTDINDSIKHKFTLHNSIYSNIGTPINYEEEIDVFFVGIDKGRFDTLIEIAEYLTKNGLNIEFYINGVNNYIGSNLKGVYLNKKLNYSEVIDKVKKSKCLLELLQDGQSGTSLRTNEAVVYNKRLITNNYCIAEAQYYNDENIHIFKNIRDIEIKWIKSDKTVDYGQFVDYFSPKKLLNFLSDYNF